MLGNALEISEPSNAPPPAAQFELNTQGSRSFSEDQRPRVEVDKDQRCPTWKKVFAFVVLSAIVGPFLRPCDGRRSPASANVISTDPSCPPTAPPQQLPPPAVMSRSLRNATRPVGAVFIDLDGTLLNNNIFSEGLLARCQEECNCDCTATTGPGSLAGFVSSLPLEEITDAFGGAVRLQRLREFVAALTGQNVHVQVLSTSWFPVDDVAWRSYISTVVVLATLPFESDDIIGVTDPGPGTAADKGTEIAERLASWGLESHEALFVDDSSGNIDSVSTRHGYRICDTVWLPQRQGMSEAVLEYIETRALGCCSWGVLPPPPPPSPCPSPSRCRDEQLPQPPPPPVAPPEGTEMAIAKVTFATDATAPLVTRAMMASALNVPSTGPLNTERAVIMASKEHDGVNYFVWDDDRNSQNDLQTKLSGIDNLRECCAEFGLSAVRITDAEQVDGVLRPLLQDGGYDLSRGSGVALGMDYSADNSYSSLEDAGVPVSSIMTDLHTSYGYSGDHQSDQTSDKQHLAGFGWASSDRDVGIEDWGFHHPMQAVLCSDQAYDLPVVPSAMLQCTAAGGSDASVGFDLTDPPGRCGPVVDSRVPTRSFYRLWDNNDNPLDDLPPMDRGIITLRERCAELNLFPVRITSAAQIDDELRPMLQKAGYDLSRGSGVPLGMDYNLRNSYEALDDASISVGQIFAEAHAERGYQGDHTSDQTGDRQHLAGFGWARSNTDVGIEDWGFHHPMQALICSDNAAALAADGANDDSGGLSLPTVGDEKLVHNFEVAVSSESTARIIPYQLSASLGILHSSVAVEITPAWLVARASDPGIPNKFYYIWDSDSNPLNDLPAASGIDELRQRCADFGLNIIGSPSTAVLDGTLRPLLQSARYDLRRPSGVPLGMDYNLRNTFESLADASVQVSAIFSELHDEYGYHGDHESDQTDDRQHLAGTGAFSTRSKHYSVRHVDDHDRGDPTIHEPAPFSRSIQFMETISVLQRLRSANVGILV